MHSDDEMPADARLALLLDSVSDHALYMFDAEGRVSTWSAAAKRVKGYDAPEILGRHFSLFFTEEDRQTDVPGRALRIAAREGRHESQGWRVRKDGTRFFANSIVEAIRSAEGNLIGFAKISRDITQRRAAEQAARDSERRFQLLVDSVTDYAIYMLDIHGCITTWNAGARRFKGYEAPEIIGEHFSRFFLPEDRKRGRPGEILRIATRDGRFEDEGWRVRKDGTRFLAHVIVDAIRNELGELVGFAKITRDITEARERQRALFNSEQRYKLLVQGIRDCAIYMLDPSGRITNWNAGAEMIKGYREADVLGKHFSLFYTEADRSVDMPGLALRTALEAGKYETEAWRVRKDGTLFWASVLIDPIYDENGEHVGFAKVTRDMSERKRVEEDLDATREALAQSQKLQAIGELTGGVAHDFNNLLMVISGAVELMLRAPDMAEEKREKYLRSMQETVSQATTLTSHLLAFSRRRTLSPEVIDLNVRLDALTEMFGRSLGSGVSVRFESEVADARVEVDPTELETALLNAAVNARDAMSGGGELVFVTRAAKIGESGAIEIVVRDSGEGMSEELISRVFEPFFTTKPVGKGTGLGLSQIHGFAAQSGGCASIKSYPGKGTELSIFLPHATRDVAPGNGSDTGSRLPEGLHVLLVEDNAQVRQFAEHLLHELGVEVTCAADASEALSLLAEKDFHLVFSDVVMPGMSGLDLANHIRLTRPQMPVLLATGYSEQLVGEGSRGHAVLTKPYGAQSLAAALAELVSPSRMRA